jgi:acyl carrier protein
MTAISLLAHGGFASPPLNLATDVLRGDRRSSLAEHLHSIRSMPQASTVGFHVRKDRRFEVFSLDSLLIETAGVAAELAEALPHGVPVLIATRSPETTLKAYLAAVLANRPPAIFPSRLAAEAPDRTAERLRDAARTLGPHGLVAESSRLDSVPETGALARVAWRSSASDRPVDRKGGRLSQGRLDSVCHYQFSSGSTRKPAAIAITHRNVLAHIEALSTRIGLTPSDTLVSWLPLGHDMGLVGKVLLSLVTGANLRLMSPFEFMTRPIDWLRAVSEHPGVVTAAPTMAFDVALRRVDRAEMGDLDLSTWKRAYCGAEPVHIPTLQRFIEAFAPFGFDPSALMPTYGLAEATLMATMPRPESTARFVKARSTSIHAGHVADVVEEHHLPAEASAGRGMSLLACLGPPADNLDLTIVDESGEALADPHQIGEVALAGPTISPGTRRPDGGLDRLESPYRTGDLGFLHDGELVIVDRMKSVLIWNGQNYSAALSEHRLASAADFSTSRLLAIEYESLSHGRSIAVVAELGRGQDPEEVADALLLPAADLDHPVHEVVVIPSGHIPRTTSGKKKRDRVRNDLSSGVLTVLATRKPAAIAAEERVAPPIVVAAPRELDLNEEDARSAVFRLINETLSHRGRSAPDLSDGVRLRDDLGLDSLDLLDICVGVEEALDIAIREEQLPELTTVGDLIALRNNGEGIALNALIDEVQRDVPQVWRHVSSQSGRLVVIEGKELVDLASVNYLGLDLDPEVMEAIQPMVHEWGVHPSWTRAVASPAPYEQLEAMLAHLTGARDTLVFPSISLLHLGVLPLLVGRGTLVVEQTAHQSIQIAADTARAQGAGVRHFHFQDLSTLEAALKPARPGKKVVALDGVYSMSGDLPPLGDIADIAEEHGAEIYLDDAHGIGVIGSDPTPQNPYGNGGGGIVKHLGLDPARFIYVSGLSKSFSSMGAFITLRNSEERHLLQQAGSIIFSGPIPVASLATAIKSLEINQQRGNQLRDRLLAATRRVIDSVESAGLQRSSMTQFPIINVVIGSLRPVVHASRLMWDEGVLLTPSVFPAAPLNRGGLRMSLTASHSDEELAKADRAISKLASDSWLTA